MHARAISSGLFRAPARHRALRRLAPALALAALAAGSPRPADARVEFIGRINGQAVYLIWGGECSALDPPTDNVALVELSYTGPPQPGVFSDIELLPPFDSFETDGETYLHVSASTPMPLPCPTCYEKFLKFTTTVPLGNPGDPSPFSWLEYNAEGGFCEGIAHHSEIAGIPSLGAQGLLLGAVALLTAGAFAMRRRGRLPR